MLYPSRLAVLALVVGFVGGYAQAERVICVDDDAPSGGDGTCWSSPFDDLHDALDLAVAGDQIHIAAGTYAPAGIGGSRTVTFFVGGGVEVYGGFAGLGVLDPEARDVALYETVLTGDLASNDGDTPFSDCCLDSYDRFGCDDALCTEVVCGLDPTCCEGDRPGWGYECADLAEQHCGDLCLFNDDNSHHVITVAGASVPTVLDGLTVSGGNADATADEDEGAGLFSASGDLVVRNCTFAGNLARWGGAANVSDGNITFDRCRFLRNASVYRAGGVACDEVEANFSACTFDSNRSLGGPAGAFRSRASTLAIGNSRFLHNRSSGGGGAVTMNYNTEAELRDCLFEDNQAGGSGGAFHLSNSEATLIDCALRENQTAGIGGAIRNTDHSALTLVGTVLAGNIGDYGGAVSSSGVGVVFQGCLLENNEARGDSAGYGFGGAVIVQGGSLDMSGCVLRNNTVGTGFGDAGGAIYAYGPCAMHSCYLTGNTASVGGAIELAYTGNLSMVNCVLEGNWSNAAGGALYLKDDSTSTLSGCTLYGNYHNGFGSFGGGIRVADQATVTVANSILWGNRAGDHGGRAAQISVPTTVYYSCVEGLDGQLGGEGNIGDDPLLAAVDGMVDPFGVMGHGLRLLPGSPCIDAGRNDLVPSDVLDVDGDGDLDERSPLDIAFGDRFVDAPCVLPDPGVPDLPDYPSVVDMGAYEYRPGDGDGDGDFDLRDISGFQRCFMQDPEGSGLAFCESFDVDGSCDGLVTSADLPAFLALLGGPSPE